MTSLEAKVVLFSLFFSTGDDLNSFSFAPGLSKGSFSPSPAPPQLAASLSMGQSWSFYNFVGGGQTGTAFPTTVRNPNKAILTIEGRTTKVKMEILILWQV